jgi:hypothetical protein
MLLKKVSKGLWILGSLPPPKTVKKAILAKALHTFVTQQWGTFTFILFEEFK